MILFIILKCFSTKKCQKLVKKCQNVSPQKMRNALIGVVVCMSFFVRLLVFELWSILYPTVVNSELGTSEKSGKVFCESDSDANQFRLGVWGARPPHNSENKNWKIDFHSF